MTRPKRRMLIFGSSGHASVLLDAIELVDGFRIVGFLDDTLEAGVIQGGYPILGKFSDAETASSRCAATDAIIAIGDNWQRRRTCWELVRILPNLRFPIIMHPSAVVSTSAELGEGTVILAGSHVGPRSRVGKFCIVNTGGSLDHDCVMSDFSSLAPGAFAGGSVKIGECSAIGVGVSISHQVSIGSHSLVGTGAAVVRDIPDFVVAYGNPAKVRRPRREGEPYL